MPIYEFEKPDGSIIEVDAPTQEAALAYWGGEEKPKLSGNPLKAAGQLVVGAFDMTGGAVDDLAERIGGITTGLVGAVNPNDTYDAARRRGSVRFRDPQPVTTGGKVIADKLGTALSYTGIPQALNAVGEGIEAVAGPNAREIAGTAAEAASLGLSRAVPKAPAAARPAAQASAVARVQNSGYLIPPHRPTGPGGEVAGTGAQNIKASLASNAVNDAKLAVANQDVTQRWAARANAIEGEISPQSIQAHIKRAEEPYDEIRSSGIEVTGDRQLFIDAVPILEEASAISPAAARSVRQLTQELGPGEIIDYVRQLRQQGFRRVAGDNVEAQEIGTLQLRAADALDGVLERSLQRAADAAASPTEAALHRRLYNAYINGRTSRANLHILEEATNVAGEVDAAVIHRVGQRRKLNPMYEEISHAYEIAPDAMQRVDRAARAARTSALTVAPSTLAGIGSMIARLAARRRGAAATPTRNRGLEEMRARNRRAAVRTTTRAAALNSALEQE